MNSKLNWIPFNSEADLRWSDSLAVCKKEGWMELNKYMDQQLPESNENIYRAELELVPGAAKFDIYVLCFCPSISWPVTFQDSWYAIVSSFRIGSVIWVGYTYLFVSFSRKTCWNISEIILPGVMVLLRLKPLLIFLVLSKKIYKTCIVTSCIFQIASYRMTDRTG